MTSRWVAGGVVALVFLSGVGVGSLATLSLSDDHRVPRRHERPHLLMHERLLERRLNLTDEQKDALRELRERHEERMRSLHPRLRKQVEEILDQHLAEVDGILDEEQRARLREILEERRRRHDQRNRSRPPGR